MLFLGKKMKNINLFLGLLMNNQKNACFYKNVKTYIFERSLTEKVVFPVNLPDDLNKQTFVNQNYIVSYNI